MKLPQLIAYTSI